MYSKEYNKIFIGMIFIIFNFNLFVINIFPDFIGYILIYSALNKLEEQCEVYKKGKLPALILSIFTLKDIFVIQNDTLNVITDKGIIYLIFGAIISLIGVYLFFIICKGIYSLSIEKGLIELSSSAKVRWSFYLLVSFCLQIYLPFSINLKEGNILSPILAIISFISLTALTLLFRKAKNFLYE